MPKPDRAPSLPRTLCPDCAFELPPPKVWTALTVAEHRVVHLEWQRRTDPRPPGLPALVDAYRSLEGERAVLQRRLRDRIRDLDEQLEATRWDLKVRDDLIDDLKADLAASEDGRH